MPSAKGRDAGRGPVRLARPGDGQAAAWLFEGVWSVFDTTTLVDVQPGYVGVYNILFGVAVLSCSIFFCLQLITGLIRRDPTALPRRARAGQECSGRSSSSRSPRAAGDHRPACHRDRPSHRELDGSDGRQDRPARRGAHCDQPSPPPVSGRSSRSSSPGLAITAAAIVWFSLLIRKALLLVAIVLGPIAISGASWDATRGWFGKWASFVIA
jgi:hypothetical protein